MAKYHLNPATGEAGACRAQPGNCPFSAGSEHYASQEAARTAYEHIMGGLTPLPLSWRLSERGATLAGPENARALAAGLHREHEALKARLTTEQFSQLHNYAMFGFERTNALLRNQTMPVTAFETLEEALQRTREQIAVLDSVFEHTEIKPRTVYRFTAAPENMTVNEAVAAWREKGTFTDPAFVSTSASIDYPLYEVLENPKKRLFLLEIATDQGAVIQPKDHHQPGHVQSMENEVLLPRAMTFEVAGVEMRKKIAFGGMRDALIEHANMWSRKDRHKMQTKPHHVLPLVKLVQA